MRNIGFFAILFFVGCKSIDPSLRVKTVTIQPQSQEIRFEEVFSKAKALNLSGEELPLSVYRVIPLDEGFLILDGKKQQVGFINSEGDFKTVISSVGEGPGEFLEIWDLKINPQNNKIFILDRKVRKLLIFSDSFGFETEIPIKKEYASSLLSFSVLSGNEILFQTSGSSGYKFMRYDISSKNFEFKVPIDQEFEGLGFGSDRSMSVLNDQVSVIYPLSNKIERYDRFLSRKEDLFVDFQGFSITESELKQVAYDQNRMFDLIQNDRNKKTHSFGIVELDRYYVISYYLGSFRNGDFLKSIVEKSTGHTKTYNTIKIGDVEVDLLLMGNGKGDELIFSLNPEKLERMSDSQIHALSKKLKISIDKNSPLLLFCTLK